MSASVSIDAGAIAALGGFFLSGAMMNIAVLDVPVLLSTAAGPSAIVAHWCKLYEHGRTLYPSIAIATCLLYVYAARRRGVFAVAAAVTMLMVPFTWIVMMPTNNALFEVHWQGTGEETVEDLVRTWGWMHLARSLFPLLGSTVGAFGAFKKYD